jgi:hypothetical protein
VHRLAREQHHVVRDVDDVVDRPLPGGRQPRLQPQRRRADRHVLVEPGREARAQVGVLDLDRHARHLPGADRIVRPRRWAERRAGGGVHLAGDAVDAQAVGPVRRDLELEHVGGDREHVGERRARLEVLGQDHDPGVLGADGDLVLGEDHPVGLHAAQLRAAELGPVGHDRARRGDGHDLPRGDVGSAADDRPRVAVADRDRADGQPVGVWVALGRQHSPDAEVLERADAVGEHALHLRPGHRQPALERVRVEVRIAVVAQPEDGDPHPNCSSNLRSLS